MEEKIQAVSGPDGDPYGEEPNHPQLIVCGKEAPLMESVRRHFAATFGGMTEWEVVAGEKGDQCHGIERPWIRMWRGGQPHLAGGGIISVFGIVIFASENAPPEELVTVIGDILFALADNAPR